MCDYCILNIILLFFIFFFYIFLDIGISQIFLQLTADVDSPICPGVDVVYTCTTDVSTISWTALPFYSLESLVAGSLGEPRDNGPVTITPISTKPFTSTLIIKCNDMLNSTVVTCDDLGDLEKSITYSKALGK